MRRWDVPGSSHLALCPRHPQDAPWLAIGMRVLAWGEAARRGQMVVQGDPGTLPWPRAEASVHALDTGDLLVGAATPDEITVVVAECARVMAPGGRLRLVWDGAAVAERQVRDQLDAQGFVEVASAVPDEQDTANPTARWHAPIVVVDARRNE